MERKDIEKCLFNALEPDDSIRKEAEMRITDLQSKDYCYFLQNIVCIFNDPSSPLQLKMISGIILKNSLHSTDSKIQGIYEQKWSSIDANIRENMKNQIINSLSDSEEKVYNLAGASLGYIARIEMNLGLFLDFFGVMEHYVMDDTKAAGVLEAVSTCCLTLSEETAFNFDSYLISIFNILIGNLEKKTGSLVAKEASLKSLINSFRTLTKLFERDEFINIFLNGIARTASSNPELTSKALICLNRFVFLNYKLLKNRLHDIINYINNFWDIENEEILVQVVEFWTILAETKEETFTTENMNMLLPHILRLMKKNEDYIEQSWNAHKASAYYLETITETYKTAILFNSYVFGFIEQELNSGDIARIDIGAITLGSVVTRGCDQQIVNFVKILITNMRNQQAEESCMWALAKICETNFFAVIEHLSLLISQACEIIIAKHTTSTNASWMLHSIFLSLNKIKENKLHSSRLPIETQVKLRGYATEQIRNHFTYVLQILVSATENAKLEDSALRVALFSALSELVRYTEIEQYGILDDFIKYCIKKIEDCVIAMHKSSTNYMPIIEDVLSNYIILSEVVAAKRQKDSAAILFPCYIGVLKTKPSSAIGEVYIAITSNMNDFIPCLDKFVPFIARDLGCTDSFILKSTINLIGCMANCIQTNFFHLSTQLIPLLIQNLSSKNVSKEVKTQILSVFGDIALALGVNFEQYLDMSMMIFLQIISLERTSDEQYIDDLRYNIVQMFDCIILATSESDKLKNIMYKLVEGIKTLISDDNSDVTKIATINLIKDLQSIFGFHYNLDGEWVIEFYDKCLQTKNSELRNVAQQAFN
jgi:importin subunit beta-1